MTGEKPEKKLSKRDKKALAFKQGTHKRKKAEPEALPEGDLLEDEEPRPSKKQKRAEQPAEETAETTKGGKKRKRGAKEGEEKEKAAQRYICFAGKLAYSVTADKLAEHFASKCSERPQVRLLTKKNEETGEQESKGAAFVEFTNSTALQEGLQLHRTSLAGRKINVELSAGGGGKGEARAAKLAKVKTRLDAQRATKAVEAKKAEAAEAEEGKEGDEKKDGPQGKNAKRKAQGGERKPRAKQVKPKEPFQPKLSGANAMRLG